MKQVWIAVLCSRVVCGAGSSIPATGNGVGAGGAGTPTPTGVPSVSSRTVPACAHPTHTVPSTQSPIVYPMGLLCILHAQREPGSLSLCAMP